MLLNQNSIKKKIIKISQNNKFLTNNANILSIYIVVYLSIFFLISIEYLPKFYETYKKVSLYNAKTHFEFLSEYFSKPGIVQILLGFSQIIFLILTNNFCVLIKQRISVPELENQGVKYFLLVFSILSITFSLFVEIIFNRTSIESSKNFIVQSNNIFFSIYLISLFIFCYLSYSLLLKFELKSIPKETYYLNVKMYLLAIMTITLINYLICLLIVSYYVTINYLQKLVICLIIVLKEINTIFFLISMLMFVASMKYDFFYLYMEMNTRPDLEYFFEDEENTN